MNDREQNDILVLPLNIVEVLSFETLSRFKSLLQWNARLEGEDLKEILLRRSLKIEFQPIVEANSGTTVAYEALSRGVRDDGSVMSPEEMFNKARSMELIFALDRICREVVIDEVKRHGILEKVFINFNPNAIYDPEKCLQSTIAAIEKNQLSDHQFVFEVVETEEVKDYDHLRSILDFYKRRGFGVALDDVGSGFNDEATLHHLIPDYIKFDMGIIRNIHQHPAQQRKMLEYVRIARNHGIKVLAEGIETREERDYLKNAGVDLMQGYFFGKPSENPLVQHG